MEQSEPTLTENAWLWPEQIASRKSLLRFTGEHEQALLALRPAIADLADWIDDEFLRRLAAHEEAARILADTGSAEALKNHLRKYVLELFGGVYGEEYVRGRLRIGRTHQRIGVTPQLYLAATGTLLDMLREIICRQGLDEAGRIKALAAVEKIMIFDAILVLDTYMHSARIALLNKQDEIRRYTANLEDMVARRTRQLAELAMRDGLTGLYNLRSLLDQLASELAGCKRRAAELSLVYFDLDGFKHLNYLRGHRGGDKILVSVARILKQVCRASDIPARYGGDEFCAILPDTPAGQAEVFCRRLIEAFDADATLCDSGTSLSIGIAQTGPEEFFDADSIIRLADKAMYKAKEKSGHAICIHGRD
ncbi:MAG: GGDEF domain-containing protein [Planctomycetes bacterium]|nr:GGDEF domain-containing protein [Planctomycetota bacterium]